MAYEVETSKYKGILKDSFYCIASFQLPPAPPHNPASPNNEQHKAGSGPPLGRTLKTKGLVQPGGGPDPAAPTRKDIPGTNSA